MLFNTSCFLPHVVLLFPHISTLQNINQNTAVSFLNLPVLNIIDDDLVARLTISPVRMGAPLPAHLRSKIW